MTNHTMTNKYPGKCAVCGNTVPAQAGTATKTPSGWVVSHTGSCAAPASEAVVPIEAHSMTVEQAEIVAAVVTGQPCCIEAFAGAGKTTVLREIAKACPQKRILYTAFNKAIVEDGRGRFGGNVEVSTIHRLSLTSLPPKTEQAFRDRMSMKRLNPAQMAQALDADGWGCVSKAGKVEIARSRMADWACQTVIRFLASDADTVLPVHTFRPDGVSMLIDPDFEAWCGPNWAELSNRIHRLAVRLWEDIKDIETSRCMTRQLVHPAYIKAFALSGRPLPADLLLVDEAQDMDPVMLSIIEHSMKAGVQIVLVGDSQQAIYAWRGAINALGVFGASDEVRTLRLTSSFRFGPEIAAKAQIVLTELGCPVRIIGAGKPGVVGPNASARAVLCRTNAAVAQFALDAIRAGRKVGVVGGTAELVKFAEACRDIKAGRGTDHHDLSAFDTWGDVQAYADSAAGGDLKTMVDLVDSLEADIVIAELSRCGDQKTPGIDVVVGTAHKTKGLEWESVQLGSDWKAWTTDNEFGPELLKVLYVAMTRAKVSLDTGAVFSVPRPA